MGIFFLFFIVTRGFSIFQKKLYTIDEGVQMSGFNFQFIIKRGMLESIRSLNN